MLGWLKAIDDVIVPPKEESKPEALDSTSTRTSASGLSVPSIVVSPENNSQAPRESIENKETITAKPVPVGTNKRVVLRALSYSNEGASIVDRQKQTMVRSWSVHNQNTVDTDEQNDQMLVMIPMPRLSTRNPVEDKVHISGFLHKLHVIGGLKIWKRQWFVLRNEKLITYKNQLVKYSNIGI
jgi:hypothetical protein